MVSFKIRCITLRRKGLTINQIAKKTGRPKTSIYFHIRQISLNKRRCKEIRLARIRRFSNYSRSIRGKSRLNRHPIPFSHWNERLISLIGHFIFDGDISRRGCVYTNRSVSLHNHVCACMKEIYLFPPKRYESLPGIYKSSFYNVELAEYVEGKVRDLLKKISRMQFPLQRSFLRAFFDDEGSVYFIGNRRAVRGYQHNAKILRLIQRLLKNFGIESRVDIKYNEITITRRENLDLFAQEINFSKGLRVNGSRSNSIWKESLEKHELLHRALASYE